MANRPKAAAWRARFLRFLRATGNVRESAEAAGIDPGTAYNHRTKDVGFALRWEEARAAAKAAGKARPPGRRRGASGGELVARRSKRHGTQMVRAAPGRWCARVEKTFFAALGRTGCVTGAAAAAGISTTALYERREAYPEFDERWRTVEAEASERLPGLLTAATIASLDPEAEPDAAGGRLPEINVDQAIAIVRLKGGGGGGAAQRDGGRGRRPRVATNAEVDAALARELAILGARQRQRQVEEGWSEAEDGYWIPPGWVRAGAGGGAAADGAGADGEPGGEAASGGKEE
ncbi:MAG TPA: hypothetical protein VF582_00820 [Allosphingosinicella sp.]|jgi:hypothetical protein